MLRASQGKVTSFRGLQTGCRSTHLTPGEDTRQFSYQSEAITQLFRRPIDIDSNISGSRRARNQGLGSKDGGYTTWKFPPVFSRRNEIHFCLSARSTGSSIFFGIDAAARWASTTSLPDSLRDKLVIHLVKF